jgi:alginate O-acetyltransferase complex protein AlgI
LICFLPATTIICLALGFLRGARGIGAQNTWLFFAGLAFCAWGDPPMALALLVSVCVCTLLGLAVERVREEGPRRRAAMAIACVFPIGLLFFVRYSAALFPGLPWTAGGSETGVLPFMRPLGIAFFTLQALSYLSDVGRGEAKAERNPVSVGLSVAFFPRLLAGPILRHAEIAPQIRERRIDWDAFSEGICRFAAGFGKVTMIAYPLHLAANYVFEMSSLYTANIGVQSIPVILAWMGLAAYALQLYHGFSGYSDMADGLSRMFGFTTRENFDYPYAARSVTDFWRRWHISLSDWFRTYLWSPFGDNAELTDGRATRYSLVVWLLIGLWHGATLTRCVWALWIFFWVTAERVARVDRRNIPALTRRLYTLFAVGIGWIFFRAPDLWNAFSYLRDVFGLNRNAFFGGTASMLLREYWPAFLLAALFAAPLARRFLSFAPERAADARMPAVLRVLLLFAFFFGGVICLVRAGGAIWV